MPGAGPTPPAPIGADLLIGLGNRCRSDDGVGWYLAQRAERWLATQAPQGRPRPRVLTVQQLTPELSVELARVLRVLFVDAWLAPAPEASRPPVALLQRLPPPSAGWPHINDLGVFSHGLQPAQLLAITALLDGRTPEAWLLLVPAFCLAHGTSFSPQLEALLPTAEALLQRWCAAIPTHA